jgi:signal transduction histidine kinase
MPHLTFTVDSALLRELGERLVGKPHIALAELVKNSYDADATEVTICFKPDAIYVIDNGHGMNLNEFRSYWMRIGSPHKARQRVSRNLQRPMTGSKGVGRLAVQFLARKLKLRTVSEENSESQFTGWINWDKAVSAGDLQKAKLLYNEGPPTIQFPNKSPHGTSIKLTGLNHEWDTESITSLAQEIWWLQPPFRANPRLSNDKQKAFSVKLDIPDESVVEQFEKRMGAILDIWTARVTGKLDSKNAKGKVSLALEFADGTQIPKSFSGNYSLQDVEFEIRIFNLVRRQPHGIRVEDARQYFEEHGGVHIYDAGFHLPYYGPDTDWLHIEYDHAHRRSVSQLLPSDLQIPEGLTFLPTQGRIFGVVHVDTSLERDAAISRGRKTDYLEVQITRDRLTDNAAFRDLEKVVRWALDFYAMEEAKRAFSERDALRAVEPATAKLQRVEDVLSEYREEIPTPAFEKMLEQVREATLASESEAESIVRRVGLLGALATAGISAVAYQHEAKKQFGILEGIADQLKAIRVEDAQAKNKLKELSDELTDWLDRAKATQALFAPLTDQENRESPARFKAQHVLDEVWKQVKPLTRGVQFSAAGVDPSIRLPMGTFAEWSAVFQNVFLNAANALLESKHKLISVGSVAHGRTRGISIQDTGSGVDLSTAEELFEPFIRKTYLSPEHRALGLGGTGLGLTIVRMVATNLSCRVAFVSPSHKFKTSFQISWSEQE